MARADDPLTQRVKSAQRRHKNRRSMPASHEALERMMAAAQDAVNAGVEVRDKHRRKHRTDRCGDLRRALDGVHAAMQPIRSELGRLPRSPGRDRRYGERLRFTSESLIAERKKLQKFLAATPC
jgi:hypothetical protein